jgi:hypothetical protein
MHVGFEWYVHKHDMVRGKIVQLDQGTCQIVFLLVERYLVVDIHKIENIKDSILDSTPQCLARSFLVRTGSRKPKTFMVVGDINV